MTSCWNDTYDSANQTNYEIEVAWVILLHYRRASSSEGDGAQEPPFQRRVHFADAGAPQLADCHTATVEQGRHRSFPTDMASLVVVERRTL